MPVTARIGEFVQYSELKQLAFNLTMLQRQKLFHSVAVLSFFPGEGRTLFCATAALAYAEASRSRVLIIDTTTLQNRGSLNLRDCFSPPSPSVDVQKMTDIRGNPDDGPGSEHGRHNGAHANVHESEVVSNTRFKTVSGEEADQNLLRSVTQKESASHGLVLFDTAPINSRNKNNLDPLVVARQSDASILIVSRKLLNAVDLNACLKIARDPTLRLVGVVANEDVPS
jgi:Mrp family chromosome partitioning ATPase